MKINKKSGFTLLEMVLALTIFFIVMGVVLQLYINTIKIKYIVEAKESLIEESYYMLEKLNVELKDYTIDYEEYYNRQMVGCDTLADIRDKFVWNINSGVANGHCDLFTQYGNTGINYYYCSSSTSESTPNIVIQSNNISQSGCFDNTISTQPYFQFYGQYKRQFRDVKNDVDFATGAVGDDDDQDLGLGPIAIYDSQHTKELYLISKNKTQRIYFRRALIASGDRNRDGTISGDNEYFYTLQMLKLRGFDAGEDHDIGTYDTGTYDGQIDTRACDYTQGFVCKGNSISSDIYSGFHLPIDNDDGRVNLLDKNLTISQRNINIQPSIDINNSRNSLSQINPYFTISFTSKLYGEIRYQRIKGNINDFQLPLQTTFNTRSLYTN